METYDLIVNDLQFSYRNERTLRDVNFKIEKSEVIGLLGVNGSGKTTLLNCIYGFLDPKNSITLLGQSPSLDNVIIKRDVSFIQDSPSLLEYLTAEQYLKFLFNINSLNYDEHKDNIFRLLEIFSLVKYYKNKLIKEYSFGMKKKLHLISEISLNKKFIIIDEPTNGLDIESIYNLKKIIKEVNSDYDTTMLISSHNVNFLTETCTRALICSNNTISRDIILDVSTNLEEEFLREFKSYD